MGAGIPRPFVAAAHLVGGAEPVVLGEDGPVGGGGHEPLQMLHLLFHGKQLPIGRAQHVLHRVASRIDRDLGDQADLPARSEDDDPVVRLQLAREQAEEGGLAAAVAAHDADALPGLDLEGQAVEKDLADLKGFF